MQEPPKKKPKVMKETKPADQSPRPLERFDMKEASEDNRANTAAPPAVLSPIKRPSLYVVRIPNSYFFQLFTMPPQSVSSPAKPPRSSVALSASTSGMLLQPNGQISTPSLMR